MTPRFAGLAPLDFTIRDGVRQSASEAFLRPVINRPNLFIQASAYVTRVSIVILSTRIQTHEFSLSNMLASEFRTFQILFNGRKRAVGVRYIFKNKVNILYG